MIFGGFGPRRRSRIRAQRTVFVSATFCPIWKSVSAVSKSVYEPGWPSLMFAILFLGGVECMLIGFVGLYINTIFLEAKGRPSYIIKDVMRPPVEPGERDSSAHVAERGHQHSHA